MHFNAEREPTKYELEAIEAIRQSHINLPTQDFQKTKLWSEKLKAGQYEVKPESVCNCTATERMFLDEIREKFYYNKEEQGLTNQGNEYDILYQDTFAKCNLQELVEKKG